MKFFHKAVLIVACSIFPASLCAAEGVTLDFWELSAGEDVMRALLDKFESQNPGIRVNLQQLSWDYGLDKVITSVAAGNAPDVCDLGTDWLPKFSSTGVLLDITDEMVPLKEHYLLWEPVTYRGRIYGAPWLAGTRILFYNRDLFDKAGLDPDKPPKTWAELKDAAARIQGMEPGIYGFGIFVGEPYAPWQQFLPFGWGNGADVLSADMTRCTLDDPAMIEAMEYYKSLKPHSIVERQPEVNQLFANGKIGIQISGAWNFALIPRMNPTLNFGVGLLPKPAHNRGTPASFAGGQDLVVFKSSKHPREAIQLIKFLMAEENAMEIVRSQRNVVPAAKAAMRNEYYQSHPEQKIFFEQVTHAVAPPNHPKWVEMQEHVTRAIEEVILNNQEPLKAFAAAKRRIEAIVTEEAVQGRLSDALVMGGFGLVWLFVVFFGYIWARRRWAKRRKVSFQDLLTSYFFVGPWLVVFLIFGLFPLLHSIVISFSRYNLLSSQMHFVGLRNYWDIVREPDFLSALWHTVYFAIGTIPFTMSLALFAAVLINRKIPFKGLYQAGLFLPVATSVIVIATIFTYLYSNDGLVNLMLTMIGWPVPNPSWLLNTKWALPAIMFMNVWASFGYYMVLFLAGLQTIPSSLYEAASIDGANEWQQFWNITLPQLKPIVLLAVVVNTINTFQVFPEIFAMTQGGPLGATTTVVWYLYETGFHRFDMGKASAVGYILFLIIMAFSLIQMKFFRMEEEGE
ncbi:MAG: extracellular solute-binding protein [Candidatus Omnitrophica bacterium]|nr:extracellular solute-binding protein [Candidatus Omnitrophota bacterium]